MRGEGPRPIGSLTGGGDGRAVETVVKGGYRLTV
jgi:hypothetical protein